MKLRMCNKYSQNRSQDTCTVNQKNRNGKWYFMKQIIRDEYNQKETEYGYGTAA